LAQVKIYIFYKPGVIPIELFFRKTDSNLRKTHEAL